MISLIFLCTQVNRETKWPIFSCHLIYIYIYIYTQRLYPIQTHIWDIISNCDPFFFFFFLIYFLASSTCYEWKPILRPTILCFNFFMFCGVACDYSRKTIACDVDQGSELRITTSTSIHIVDFPPLTSNLHPYICTSYILLSILFPKYSS